MSNMVMVELVADREYHRDTMYGTDLVWRRQGAIQPVPEAAWLKMSKHGDVYRIADAKPVEMRSLARAIAAEAAGEGEDRIMVMAQTETETEAEAETDAGGDGEAQQAAEEPDAAGRWTEEMVLKTSEDTLRDVAATLGKRIHPRTLDQNVRKAFRKVVGLPQPDESAEPAEAAAGEGAPS